MREKRARKKKARPRKPAMSLSAMPADEVVRLLRAAGSERVTAEMLQADLDSGAPVNGDGSINLLHLAAWIAREVPT